VAVAGAVTAQGRTLKVRNTAKHYAWRFEDGAYIQTTWERYKPGFGNTITIETGAHCGCQNLLEALLEPCSSCSRSL